MKIKNIITATAMALAIPAAIGMTSSAFAAQTCQLGETCPIPGEDNGQTVFKVKPSNGTEYICELESKSQGESLIVNIGSGKDFTIVSGDKIFRAEPKATAAISGRFSHPNNAESEGEIKITQMPLSAQGTVKCYPKKAR